MRKRKTARKYANALMGVAPKGKSGGNLREELKSLNALFDRYPKLYVVLSNPMYHIRDRIGLSEALTERLKVSAAVRRFLSLLVESGNLKILPDICTLYGSMSDEREGRVNIVMETPKEIDPDMKEKVRERLKSQTGKEVILKTVINETLLGGILLRIGNTVFDSTIKRQLEKMEQKILEGVVQ